jgi:hypothetical protein
MLGQLHLAATATPATYIQLSTAHFDQGGQTTIAVGRADRWRRRGRGGRHSAPHPASRPAVAAAVETVVAVVAGQLLVRLTGKSKKWF